MQANQPTRELILIPNRPIKSNRIFYMQMNESNFTNDETNSYCHPDYINKIKNSSIHLLFIFQV